MKGWNDFGDGKADDPEVIKKEWMMIKGGRDEIKGRG